MRIPRALFTVMTFGLASHWACGDEIPPPPGLDPSTDASTPDGAGTTSSSGGRPAEDDPGTPVYPEQHPRILLSNEALRERLQNALRAEEPAARRFHEMVERQQSDGNVYAYKPWYSALLYALTGEERYASYAVAQTESFVGEEEALIDAGQRPSTARNSYLYVGEEVGGLLLVYDWCHDHLTEAQRTRWLAYANQAIWNVWNHEQARWGDTQHPWSGWSVDNPGNNYYYSFLEATMLFGLAAREEHDAAEQWLEMFRTTKLRDQAVPFFRDHLIGGGSQEGTGYGVAFARLFKLYAFWEYTTTERIARLTPHPRASMPHMMHTIVPTLDYTIPTGDHARVSSGELFDYHRDYLQILASLYEDERMAAVARGFLAESSVPQMGQAFMFYSDFLFAGGAPSSEPPTALASAYYGAGTGQISVRSDWSKGATFFNLLCGPYTESHAHRDQGSFLLYRNQWLAYDANYHAQSGIEQAEEFHNLVRVEQGGATVRQKMNRACTVGALANTPHFAYVRADATSLYEGEGAVTKMERESVFLKPDTVVVLDRVGVGSGASRIWQLNTPTRPVEAGATLRVQNQGSSLEVFRVAPASATVQIHAWADGLPAAEGAVRDGYRTDVRGSDPVFLHVLGTQGAVSSVEATSASGQTGARITFSDGRAALVQFSTSGRGGSLTYTVAGSTVHDGPLPNDVEELPLFRP